MAGKASSAVSKQIAMGNLFGEGPKGMTAADVFSCLFVFFVAISSSKDCQLSALALVAYGE